MNFRFSLGHRWFEVWFLDRIGIWAFIYFRVEYGHNSQRNLIDLTKAFTKGRMRTYFRWLERKPKWITS